MTLFYAKKHIYIKDSYLRVILLINLDILRVCFLLLSTPLSPA